MRRSRSIRNVMLGHFAMSSLLPAALLSFLLFGVCLVMMVRQSAQTNLAALELAARNTENRMENIVDLSVRLPSIGGTSTALSSDSLYSLVIDNDPDTDLPINPDQYRHYMRIRTMLNQSFLQLNPYINGIYVFDADGPVLSFGGSFAVQSIYAPLVLESVDEYDLPAFVPGGMQQIYDIAYSLHPSNVRVSCMTYFSLLQNMHTQETLALLAIDMDDGVFEFLDELAQTHGANLRVVDTDGNVIYSCLSDAEEEAVFAPITFEPTSAYDWRTGSMMCSCALSDKYGMMLQYSVGIDLFETMEPALMLVLFAGFVLILYMLLATFQNTRRFARPVMQLSRIMTADDRLPASAEPNSDIEEFRILYARYNEMLESIAGYIDQKYANELLLIRARMQAMEAQIDSHFLYNTLECIYSMALLDGCSDVAQVVKSLSNTFRYISRTESAVVTIGQELEHVKDYVAIQQARLGDDISCIITVDDSLLGCRMLKLSLQPLVENAFMHGFQSGPRPRSVYLTCEKREGNLVFFVRDNGAGIQPERLEQLRSSIATRSGSEGVGLVNIANRLRIYYGERASLTIDSEPLKGTLVTMIIPEGEIA